MCCASPVRRGLIPEVALANLPGGKQAPRIKCDRILFACNDFKHHSAGVELVTDDYHIGDYEGHDGQHPCRAAKSLADDFRHG